jgi:hypothetical protein
MAANDSTGAAIAAIDSTSRALAYFSSSDFDKASRRFLFTISNRTNRTFTLVKTHTDFGIIETPWRELGPATNNQSSELRIRGYRARNKFRGVTCALHFCIHNPDRPNAENTLSIFLEVAYLISDNTFGWYIEMDSKKLQTSTEWFKRHASKDDKPKSDPTEKRLFKGTIGRLHAEFSGDGLDIEMFVDNSSDSTPSMIIKECK